MEVLEVDLRWGITEEQSKSGETLRICLEEIDRCRPSAPVFFVGLLGERYGWIPPRDYFKPDVLEDPNLGWVKEHIDGKSVTELEILHGVLRNETMRDKSFFYFRNDGYQERHWDAIASHHEGILPPLTKEDFTNAKSANPEADAAKQRDLKQRVRDVSFKWDPKDYETPQNLASLILEDLWAAINLVFPASSVPNALDREALEHAAFGQSRIKGYVPRLGLFEQLDGVFTSPTPSVKIVTGESGSGKSALLAAWISNLGTRIPERHFVHYIGGTPESASVGSIIRRLMAQIRAWGAVADPIPDDLSDAVELLPNWLQRSVEGQKDGVLIVLDALNQIEKEWDKTLWWLPKDLPEGVRVVASTLTGSSQSALEKRGWTKSSVSVPLLGDDEKRTIIVSYLANFSKGLAGPLADRLVKAPQAANPLFLRVVLDELRLRARHENLASSLDKMLQAKNPVELYVKVLKNLEEFDKDRPNLVREAMGYLAAARRGLTESELLQLLSMADSPATNPLPRHLWSPLYLALEDSLVSRNGQLGFFHDYLRQAVELEYLDEKWEREKIHGRFGEVAEAWNTERFSPSLRKYGLGYGAWHLRMTGAHERLWQILCESQYLTAQRIEFQQQHESIAALKNGVELFAERNGQELEDDARLCKLVLLCGETAENARSSLSAIFSEFISAKLADSEMVERAFDKLSIISEDLLFSAGQILLLKESERALNERAPTDRKTLVKILERLEERVSKDTIVSCNCRLEERLVEVLPIDLWKRMAEITDKVPQGTEINQEVWPDESERWNPAHRLSLYTVEGWRVLFCARTLARLKRWDDIRWLLQNAKDNKWVFWHDSILATLAEGLIRNECFDESEDILPKIKSKKDQARLYCLLAEKLQAKNPNESQRITRILRSLSLEAVDKTTSVGNRLFEDNSFIIVLRTIRILHNLKLTNEVHETISSAKNLIAEFQDEEMKNTFMLSFVDLLIEIGWKNDAEEMACGLFRAVESVNKGETQWFKPENILNLARIFSSLGKKDYAISAQGLIKETESRKRNSWDDEKARDDATSVLKVRVAILAASNSAIDTKEWKEMLKETMSLDSYYAFQGLNDCLDKAFSILKSPSTKELVQFFFDECFEFFKSLNSSPENAILAFGKLARICIECGQIEKAYEMLGVTFEVGAKIADHSKSFNERVAEFAAFRDKIIQIDETQKIRIYDWGNQFLASQRKYYRENQVYDDCYQDPAIRAALLGLVASNYFSINENTLANEVLDESLILLSKTNLVELKTMMLNAIAGLLAGQAKRSNRYLEFWIKGLETSTLKGEPLLKVTLLKNLIPPLLQKGFISATFKVLESFNQEGAYKQIYISQFKYDLINDLNCYLVYNDLKTLDSSNVSELLSLNNEDRWSIILYIGARIRFKCKNKEWATALQDLDFFPQDYEIEKFISRIEIVDSIFPNDSKIGFNNLNLAWSECLNLIERNDYWCFYSLAKLFSVSAKYDASIAAKSFDALLATIEKTDLNRGIFLNGYGPDSDKRHELWPMTVAKALHRHQVYDSHAFFELMVCLLEKKTDFQPDYFKCIVDSISECGNYRGYEDHLARLYFYCRRSVNENENRERDLCGFATSLLSLSQPSNELSKIIDEIIFNFPSNPAIAEALLKTNRIEDFLKHISGVFPQSWANYVEKLCLEGDFEQAKKFIFQLENFKANNPSYSISEENLLASKIIISLINYKDINEKNKINDLLKNIQWNESHYFIFLNYVARLRPETVKKFCPIITEKISNFLPDNKAKVYSIAALSLAITGEYQDSLEYFRQAVRLTREPRKFGDGTIQSLTKEDRNKCMEFIISSLNASSLNNFQIYHEIRETLLSVSDFEFLNKLDKDYYSDTGWHDSTNAEIGIVHNLKCQSINESLQCSRWRQMMTLCPSNHEINFKLLGQFFASLIKQNDISRLNVIAEFNPELSLPEIHF